jgi:hypothetical protein
LSSSLSKKLGKKGYFTAYLVLKGCDKHKKVCARTVPSVRLSYLGEYRPMDREGTRLSPPSRPCPRPPTKNNDIVADDDRQQQQPPPLPPMLQQLLNIHCHLTNQPYLPADHNSPSIPLPSCLTVHVEPKRFNRSRTQNFYILDSPARRLQFPTKYLIGNTGNLYTISFTISGVCCNCPDTTSFCKRGVPSRTCFF